MTTKSKLGLLVAGALAALLLAWSDRLPLPGFSDGQGKLVADGKPDEDSSSAENAPRAAGGAAERSADPTPADLQTSASATSWILRGRLRGVEEQAPWTTPIEVVAWYDTLAPTLAYAPRPDIPPILALVQADQLATTFEVDLTSWFSGDRPPARVEVIADDPAYVVASESLIPPANPDRNPDGGLAWRTEIQVQLASAVQGRVTDERGHPLAGVCVGLLRGEPEFAGVVRTDANGSYRLRTSEIGKATLLALLRCSNDSPRGFVEARQDLRPAMTTVQLNHGANVTAPILILTSGAAIEGRVVSAAGTPVSGAIIKAKANRDAAASGPPAWLGPHKLYLDGNNLTSPFTLTVSDELGRFRLQALDPESTYQLTVPFVDDSAVTPVATVTAPARPPRTDIEATVGVPVEIVAHQADGTRLDVVRGGAAMNELLGIDRLRPDARWKLDRPALWAWPEIPIRVVVSAPGHLDQFRIISCAPGAVSHREVFNLVAEEASRHTIRLRLQNEAGLPIRRSGVWVSSGGGNVGHDFLADDTGWFEIPVLQPGPASLVIRGGGSLVASESYYLEDRVDVDVPELGEVAITRTLSEGGRLRLRATDTRGTGLPAKVRIFDENGAPVEIELSASRDRSGMLAGMSLRDRLSSLWTTIVDPALEAGLYDLTLSLDGHRDLTVRVEIEVGRTTDLLDLVMEQQ